MKQMIPYGNINDTNVINFSLKLLLNVLKCITLYSFIYSRVFLETISLNELYIFTELLKHFFFHYKYLFNKLFFIIINDFNF